MTTQEIKALVAAKIAGQGNQVDLGNALSDIINSLCDLIDAGGQGGGNKPLIVPCSLDSGEDDKKIVSVSSGEVGIAEPEVVAAFRAGRPVLFEDGANEFLGTLVDCYDEAVDMWAVASSYGILSVTWG